MIAFCLTSPTYFCMKSHILVHPRRRCSSCALIYSSELGFMFIIIIISTIMRLKVIVHLQNGHLCLPSGRRKRKKEENRRRRRRRRRKKHTAHHLFIPDLFNACRAPSGALCLVKVLPHVDADKLCVRPDICMCSLRRCVNI